MIIYVDIDETICDTPDSRDYTQSIPLKDRIAKINKLHDEGHTIVYWTARGTLSGKCWREVTEKQFSEWDVKYSSLEFKKPFYDLFIDDRNINSDTYFNEESN